MKRTTDQAKVEAKHRRYLGYKDDPAWRAGKTEMRKKKWALAREPESSFIRQIYRGDVLACTTHFMGT